MSKLSAKIHALGVMREVNGKEEAGKGTLSVYGLNARFPLTLYANQWRELATAMPGILKIIDAGLKAGTLAGERSASATPSAGGRVAL